MSNGQGTRRVSVEDFICEDGNVELDRLWDAQPMEVGQRVGDMVR